MFVKWDITQRCNLKCTHCAAVESYGEMLPVLKATVAAEFSTDECLRIIDDMAASGVETIHFLGGEPFIRDDFIHILEHCARRGVRVGINTNGTYLTEERLKHLLQLPNIANVTFSVDGGNAETNDFVRSPGSFVGVTRALKVTLASLLGDRPDHPVKTNTCVTRPLAQNPRPLLDLFESMPKLKRISFSRLDFEGGAARVRAALEMTVEERLDFYERVAQWAATHPDRKIYLDTQPRVLDYLNQRFGSNFEIKGDTCPAGSVLSHIDASGKMYPCNRRTVINFMEDYGILNWERNDLRRHRFLDIYSSNQFHQFYRFVNDPAIDTRRYPCTGCGFLPTCYSCPISVLSAGVLVAETCMLAERRRREVPEC